MTTVKQKNVPALRFPEFTDDWEQRKLGEVLTERNEQIPESIEYPLMSFVQGSGVKPKGDRYDRSFLVKDKNKKYKKTELGDFIYSSNNLETGSIGFNKTGKAVISPVYSIFYSKTDLGSHFIGILSTRKDFINKMIHFRQGVIYGQWRIHERDFLNIKIFIPENVEQNKIIDLFKQLDETITLHQRKLDLLKEQKKGFLQKMFPKNGEKVPELRFKGFADDWELRKLGEIMKVTSVKRIHQSDWTDSGVRFMRARDIVSKSKNEEPTDYIYISQEKYNEYSKLSGKVSYGDLLVTGVGSIGVPLLITDDTPVYFKDGNIIWFKNEQKIEGYFFYYSFMNSTIQKYISDVAGIGTVGTYTIDSGKKTPITLPIYEEQQKIGNFFKQLDDTIALHQRKVDLLKEQKKSFLQKMFV